MKKAEPNKPEDDRAPWATGYAWATRITGIGLEVALPVLLGAWLDRRMGTTVLFVLLGTFLGMGIGFVQLLKIVREEKR